jgi:transposase-like protein
MKCPYCYDDAYLDRVKTLDNSTKKKTYECQKCKKLFIVVSSNTGLDPLGRIIKK